jgi:hypothetical protein
LPRKVRYRQRKKAKTRLKVNKTRVLGRSYNDFLEFVERMEHSAVVEMDTMEGRKGGKVLLTLSFVNSSLMLTYLRDGEEVLRRLGAEFMSLQDIILKPKLRLA